MKIIARCTVRLLQQILKNNPHIKYQHVIGFSLGAQIAGTIAKILNEKKIDKLDRITGLDPALLRFENGGSILNADSATVVDIIHTNSGVSGQILPIGTVDFYANGGIRQPGCEYDLYPVYCHHHRAYYYFAESINYRRYNYGIFANLSCSCLAKDFSLLGGDFEDVHVRVGEYLDLKTRGVYYFKTNSVMPFALKV
ncbi:Triacylglycerol lipase family,Lipase/vitellogenin,Alpha/Beta hydrolase fold [Cinara cedri]|uniref:Triacylglycerol lipase family,Lipase/vitellogenin,Alpha/Beta hydrolase fold n=1 Tax=Cinara cedri TaxID=506608 RepID=A0A5E4N931_9HEMI|nr:Triacylglycerol lipase family,Lipase/vitellogenin,Alpha/Beta hydrolase fold [Cinara cedri]